jgi:hypothetical protein
MGYHHDEIDLFILGQRDDTVSRISVWNFGLGIWISPKCRESFRLPVSCKSFCKNEA